MEGVVDHQRHCRAWPHMPSFLGFLSLVWTRSSERVKVKDRDAHRGQRENWHLQPMRKVGSRPVWHSSRMQSWPHHHIRPVVPRTVRKKKLCVLVLMLCRLSHHLWSQRSIIWVEFQVGLILELAWNLVFPIQMPESVPGKAMDDGPNVWHLPPA